MIKTHPDSPAVYEFYSPLAPLTGVLGIPHSGEVIPKEFEKHLNSDQRIRNRDIDYRVHHLIDIEELRKAGVAVIKSNIHRIAVDLNRAPNKAILNWKKTSQGEPLVLKEFNNTEELKALGNYFYPYYELMKGLIEETTRTLGKPCSFVDLHSMPSKATAYHLKRKPDQKVDRPDFCLSDQFGVTCVPEFIQLVQTELNKHGHQTLINDPYIGGNITVHVNAAFNTNNIQIEISRAIYMDEDKLELVAEKVEKLKPILTQTLVKLFQNFK